MYLLLLIYLPQIELSVNSDITGTTSMGRSAVVSKASINRWAFSCRILLNWRRMLKWKVGVKIFRRVCHFSSVKTTQVISISNIYFKKYFYFYSIVFLLLLKSSPSCSHGFRNLYTILFSLCFIVDVTI